MAQFNNIKVSGTNAIIDEKDYEIVSAHNWWLTKQGYAYTQTCTNNVRTTILMHRLIMRPNSKEVDHINGDKLDNRRSNLRICTRSQNNANKPHTSGKYKGVRYNKNAWQAEIKKNKKYIYIGRFKEIKDAAKAYDEKAVELFGDFAYTNFNRIQDGRQ